MTVYIKLRLSDLDDERIVNLTPTAFRTLILLRLVAGVEDRDGELPGLGQMAFRLRTTGDALEPNLSELARAGLIENAGAVWRLTTFRAEQAPISNAERQRAWYERHNLHPNESLEPPEVLKDSTNTQVQDKSESRQGESLGSNKSLGSPNKSLGERPTAENDNDQYSDERLLRVLKERGIRTGPDLLHRCGSEWLWDLEDHCRATAKHGPAPFLAMVRDDFHPPLRDCNANRPSVRARYQAALGE